MFWTPEIRLVDCPGLVLPNYVPMEIQALCSILPISQIPSMPSCIGTVASLMPLEEIFSLVHPSITHPEPAVEDRRTWRAHQSKEQVKEVQPVEAWTAMDIMTAYALKKGWVTAKAGRPDVNRAGNASKCCIRDTPAQISHMHRDKVLRTVAENRVRWAFWPPNFTPKRTIIKGIWIVKVESEQHVAAENPYEESDGDSDSAAGSDEEDEGEHHVPSADETEEGEEEEEDDDEEEDGDDTALTVKTSSRFGLLAVANDDEDMTEGNSDGKDGS